jgi:hypothetical protein
MNEETYEFEPSEMWLTRAEAARYVGVSGESAIRAAETKGLHHATTDAAGQVWHRPETLDAWKWRAKAPTATHKKRVLREAAKARQHEARTRERKREMEIEKEQAEWDMQMKAREAELDAEQELRVAVRRKNGEMRAAFKSAHMDGETAGKCLGFKSYEADWRLRELVDRGLLQRFDSPPERTVSYDGDCEIDSSRPLCFGGPFFLREEVQALRRELADAAGDALSHSPEHLRAEAGTRSEENIGAALLRILLSGQR